MGLVYADIELNNAIDFENARRHIIGEDEVRSMKLNVLADSGAYMMAFNEKIQSQLELPLVEKRKVQMADNRLVEYDVAGPIHVLFANTKATFNAFVLPGDSEPLLGAIPIEEKPVQMRIPKILPVKKA